VRFRHHPEQPVAVDDAVADDLAVFVRDRILDTVYRAPGDLVADPFVAVAARFAVVVSELAVSTFQGTHLVASDADVFARFTDRAAAVLFDVGEELVPLLGGQRLSSGGGGCRLELFGHAASASTCRNASALVSGFHFHAAGTESSMAPK
jgi:hypothetical protein